MEWVPTWIILQEWWAGEWAVDYWVNRMIDRWVLVGG